MNQDQRWRDERAAKWVRLQRQWRRGWHVTPTRFLPSIQRVGLVPYWIDRDDMGVRGPGIFTWVNRPTGLSLAGIVVHRLIAHQAWHLTLLSYLYRPADCWPLVEGEVTTVFHAGSLGPANEKPRWEFHENEEGHVLAVPVPPERIRAEASYDLGSLFGL